MVESLLRGDFSFNLGFVGIVIGHGLLEGHRSSRLWAVGLSGLGILALVATAGWSIYSGQFRAGRGEHGWFGEAYLLLMLLIFAVVFMGLRSKSVRAWFDTDSANRTEGDAWTVPLIVVGVIFATTFSVKDHLTASSAERLFPVHTRFEFRDANTGDVIQGVAISSNFMSSYAGQRDLLAPRITISSGRGSVDGTTMELTGISGRPVDITFTSEGYQSSTYLLGSESPQKVTLNLQPSR